MKIFESVASIRTEGRCAVALGAFDGLHRGHCRVIEAAGGSGAGENSPELSVFTFAQDPSLAITGQAEYLMTGGDKERLLEEMGVQNLFRVDFSAVRELAPEAFFREILVTKCRAAVLSCGEDFRFGKNAAGDTALLKSLCREAGVEVRIVPPVTEGGIVISSTAIRRAVKAGEMAEAARLLGRNFFFTLPVSHGNRIGRTLGSPTINQILPEGFIRPRFGVYAAAVQLEDGRRWGVCNLGVKPTVGSDRPLAETWIGEFNGDLYGKEIRVELLEFIREEKKFASLEELKTEIYKNAETARNIFFRRKGSPTAEKTTAGY